METTTRPGRRRLWIVMGLTMMMLVTLAGIGGGLAVAAPMATRWLARYEAAGDGGGLATWMARVGVASDVAAAQGANSGTTPEVDASTVAQDRGDAADVAAVAPADAMAVVAAQEQVLESVYQQALPSVVHLRVTQSTAGTMRQFQFQMPNIPGLPSPFGSPDGQSPFGMPQTPDDQGALQRGEGSGFVWDAEGHIVTNNHVVDNASKVVVVFADGTEAAATVVGTDPDADLAVVKVDVPAGKLRAIRIGDSDAVKVGQMAIAIGNPFGLANTMTTGIVSAVGRTIGNGTTPFSIPEVIQTDAPINPGNSGGPLLDRLGRVIGINSQIVSRTGANAGIGFAVPINIAKRVVPELIRGGDYDYAWLGITGQTLTAEIAAAQGLPMGTQGALVQAVATGGPADKAGLRGSDRQVTDNQSGETLTIGGDVVVAIEGRPIVGMDDMIAYLTRQTRPGDAVALDVIRAGGSRETITVTLEARPDQVDEGAFEGRR